MSLKKLLLDYAMRSGDTLIYTMTWSTKVKGHEVAWLKVRMPRAAESVWMLRCECHFTEGVGWKFDDSGVRVSLIGPISPHTLYVMEKKHAELRREFSEWPKGEDVILEIAARAKYGEFVGEDGSRSGYGISLRTLTAVTGLAPGQTLSFVRKLVRSGRLADMGQDVVGLP